MDRDGLWVEARGPENAPVAVLVHGALDRSSSFGRVTRRLSQDTRVVRYDRRGYAGSADAPGPYTVEANVADLCGVLAGYDRPVVVGHSFGGVLALAVAARHPRLLSAAMVFEAPMSWESWWMAMDRGSDAGEVDPDDPGSDGTGVDPADAAEAFMRRMIGDAMWARLPPSTREARRREGRVMVEESADLRRAAPFRLADVAVPLVVGHGSHSDPRHQRAALEVATRVPDTPLVRVEGSDHGAHLSHPEEFAIMVRLTLATARR